MLRVRYLPLPVLLRTDIVREIRTITMHRPRRGKRCPISTLWSRIQGPSLGRFPTEQLSPWETWEVVSDDREKVLLYVFSISTVTGLVRLSYVDRRLNTTEITFRIRVGVFGVPTL